MNANELRLGNWVYMISKDKYYLIDRGQDIDNSEDFEPIQLTEEILLKCGFDKRSDGHFNIFKQSDVDIIIYNDFSSWKCDGVNFSVNYIKYLHQLQNLYFALTGEELEINL